MNLQKIEDIRKKFHNEWLLITIGKIDKTTYTPLTGKLLAHSKSRDEIYNKEMKYKCHTLTIYSDDELPEGYAAAFYVRK